MTVFLPWWWRWAALAILCAACAGWGAVKMHGHDLARYEALQAEYGRFREGVAAEGAKAQAKAKASEIAQKQALAQLQANYNAQIAGFRDRGDALAIQLRDATRAGGGPIGESGRSAGCPEGAVCYDKGRLDAGIREALERFAGGFESLILRGQLGEAGLQSCVAGWESIANAAR